MFKFILVEIRFHLSDHFFLCTSEQINRHMIVYLIGETLSDDNEYRWNETIAKTRGGGEEYYNIKCISERRNQACEQFKQQIWGYCENVNVKNGYSIVRRQFMLMVERFKPLNLYYVCGMQGEKEGMGDILGEKVFVSQAACCWANSSNKYFYFNLSIETDLTRMNSSPYPYLPAAYYVPLNQSKRISIFVWDDDGKETSSPPS